MDCAEMTDRQRSILMRLYAAWIEEFQYSADLVDRVEADVLVGLGLVMIHPTRAEITERGVLVWELWCRAHNRHWTRPTARSRAFRVLKYRKAS